MGCSGAVGGVASVLFQRTYAQRSAKANRVPAPVVEPPTDVVSAANSRVVALPSPPVVSMAPPSLAAVPVEVEVDVPVAAATSELPTDSVPASAPSGPSSEWLRVSPLIVARTVCRFLRLSGCVA